MNELLAVSIPTYKRPAQLAYNLDSIIPQAKHFDVPVYICDDSCDGTNLEVLRRYSDSYPNLIVASNAENLGIDANIRKSMDVPDSDYVWLLGEDDRLVEGAIAKVIKVLSSHSYDFLVPNYVRVKDDLSRTIAGPRIDLTEDRTVDEVELYASYSWAIGFIGGCIVKKSHYSTADRSRFMGTYFNHVGMILDSLPVNAQIRMIAEVLVLNRSEGADSFTWSGEEFDVFFGFERMLKYLELRFGSKLYRVALAEARKQFGYLGPKWLAGKRADSLYGPREFDEYLREADIHPALKVIQCVISVTPTTLLKPLKYLFKDVYRNKIGKSISETYGVAR